MLREFTSWACRLAGRMLHADNIPFFKYLFCCSREGNGNPLQYSCLENPTDRGAWWAAVCGVAQRRTRLKQLSSSSILLSCLTGTQHGAGPLGQEENTLKRQCQGSLWENSLLSVVGLFFSTYFFSSQLLSLQFGDENKLPLSPLFKFPGSF